MSNISLAYKDQLPLSFSGQDAWFIKECSLFLSVTTAFAKVYSSSNKKALSISQLNFVRHLFSESIEVVKFASQTNAIEHLEKKLEMRLKVCKIIQTLLFLITLACFGSDTKKSSVYRLNKLIILVQKTIFIFITLNKAYLKERQRHSKYYCSKHLSLL